MVVFEAELIYGQVYLLPGCSSYQCMLFPSSQYFLKVRIDVEVEVIG